MRVTVVRIGPVFVGMRQRPMNMGMRMGLGSHVDGVVVPVVLVVDVGVVVVEDLVDVLAGMPFGQHQRDAQGPGKAEEERRGTHLPPRTIDPPSARPAPRYSRPEASIGGIPVKKRLESGAASPKSSAARIAKAIYSSTCMRALKTETGPRSAL